MQQRPRVWSVGHTGLELDNVGRVRVLLTLNYICSRAIDKADFGPSCNLGWQ